MKTVRTYRTAAALLFALLLLWGVKGADTAAQDSNRRNLDSPHRLSATNPLRDKVLAQEADSLKREVARYNDGCKYDEAVRTAQRLIPLLEAQGDSVGIAVYYTEMGVARRNLGQLTEALQCFNTSNSILEHSQTPDSLQYRIDNLYNISVIYTHNKNFAASERIARDCVAAVRLQPQTNGNMCLLARCYHSLAVVLCDHSQSLTGEEKKLCLNEAIEHGLEAYRLSSAYNDTPLNLARRIILLGQLYSSAQSYDKANQYFNEALALSQNNDFHYITAKIYEELALIADVKGESETEALMLEQSIKYAEKSLNKVSLLQTLKTTYDLYRKKNSPSKALDYYERYIALKDTILNERQRLMISDFEVKYETEKKALRISALEEEKRLLRWIAAVGGAALLLALTALFFLWLWTRQKRRLAEQQIRQFEQERQLIATQAMFDGEVKERTRLARDLHDRLGGVLTATKFNLAEIRRFLPPKQPASEESFNKTMSLLDESISEMRRIAHHLMPDSLLRFGLKAAISEFCKSIPHARFSWFGGDERFDTRLELSLYRIAYELVNNALKHSGASIIKVQIVRDPDRVALTVEDNGCGFDVLAGQKGEGMGLSNVRAQVTSFNGAIDVGSAPGEGTEINVEFSLEADAVVAKNDSLENNTERKERKAAKTQSDNKIFAP